LEELAEREGITVEQFITTAVAEKMAALMTESYLAERAKRGNRAKNMISFHSRRATRGEPNNARHRIAAQCH
jgi:hypothetical protein